MSEMASDLLGDSFVERGTRKVIGRGKPGNLVSIYNDGGWHSLQSVRSNDIAYKPCELPGNHGLGDNRRVCASGLEFPHGNLSRAEHSPILQILPNPNPDTRIARSSSLAVSGNDTAATRRRNSLQIWR